MDLEPMDQRLQNHLWEFLQPWYASSSIYHIVHVHVQYLNLFVGIFKKYGSTHVGFQGNGHKEIGQSELCSHTVVMKKENKKVLFKWEKILCTK